MSSTCSSIIRRSAADTRYGRCRNGEWDPVSMLWLTVEEPPKEVCSQSKELRNRLSRQRRRSRCGAESSESTEENRTWELDADAEGVRALTGSDDGSSGPLARRLVSRGSTQPMHSPRSTVNADVDGLGMYIAEKPFSRERTEKGRGMFLRRENSCDGLKITVELMREAQDTGTKTAEFGGISVSSLTASLCEGKGKSLNWASHTGSNAT